MKKLVAIAAFLWSFAAAAQNLVLIPPSAAPGIPGLGPLPHPGYVVNNWYVPWPGMAVPGSGWANPGANKVSCSFGSVLQTLTISNLGVDITTLSGGGNIQLAIYNNGSWGRPSTLVIATASITTAATGQLSAAAAVQLPVGGYWFCSNMDNATAIIVAYSGIQGMAQAQLGGTPQGHIINASTGTTGVVVAQTFGTWPAFTSGTAWSDINTATSPDIAFEVNSVP